MPRSPTTSQLEAEIAPMIEMSADVTPHGLDLNATAAAYSLQQLATAPGTQPLTSAKAANLKAKKTERVSDYGSTQHATI